MTKNYHIARILLLPLCLIIIGCISLGATQPYSPQIINPLIEPWRWQHFPELEGKGIRHIVETPNQKVWVSCNEGVLEYNGYYWTNHNASNGLDASPIEQLLVTKDGGIYATSTKGIFKYDGTNWNYFFEVPSKFSFEFHDIKQLQDNSIIASTNWGMIHFGTKNKVAFYTSLPKAKKLNGFFPEVQRIYLPEASLNESEDFYYASDVLEEEDGTLWFAISSDLEEGKLLKFRRETLEEEQIGQFEVVSSAAGSPLGEGQKLLLAQDGKIWVINSTSNKGIHVFDGRKWEVIHLNEQFGGDEYMADIIQSANGAIWISSMAKIYAFEKGRWQKYRAPEYPIPANHIILQNSSSHQIWVAGYKSKVSLFDFSTENWVTYANLSFQCEISPEQQWFLEANNLIVQRNGDKWISHGVADGVIDSPTRIIKTSTDQIWVAGSHQGLAATAVLKDGKWERHVHPKLSWGIDYRAVFEARDGSIWFGGSVDADRNKGFLCGILQLPNPTDDKLKWVHHVYRENGLTQANAYGIGQSKDGKIWIGGSKLLNFDGRQWNQLEDERLQQYVNYVYSTDELLLVGSRYYGLFIFDGKKWENQNTSTGLSGNTIISIDLLPDSSIIVATENDICRFDGSSWTHNIFPQKLNMEFEGGTIFHTAENELWINHVPRPWKRRAYNNNFEQIGKAQFFTTFYRPDPTPPETTFDFFLESVSPRGNSLISWQGKDFQAQTPSESLSYSYRLDGGEWSPFSTKKQQAFMGLPSGDHSMEVRARDLDFNVDPTPARIEFRVLPPIWRQAWFLTLLLLFLIIFGIYEYRVLSKKRKLEILNASLQKANKKLKFKGRKIEEQNREILEQQAQILKQANILEVNNKDLEGRNEEIRQQRDKLEEMVEKVERLSKDRLTFFTNISHELRTPLSLILGPISILQDTESKLSTTQRNQFYQIIQRNAARLLKLINQLLELRRIEQRTLALKLSEIRLPMYISEMMALFKSLAAKRNIHLDFVDTSEDNFVALDADKVEKIIVNLLSNAFKYTPEGGNILLTLETIYAADEGLKLDHEKYFKIKINDNGCGIEQDQLDIIFEKYYTSASNLQEVKGVGIGLYYTKDLIRLMKGEIKVNSEIGVGTTFIVYLPFNRAKNYIDSEPIPIDISPLDTARKEASLLWRIYAPPPSLPEDPVISNHKLPQVLIVEDNPDMLHLLETVLNKKYSIITARNGKEGLTVAQDHTIDLIISDVMMPEMDGLEFCEKIKNKLITSHIPVVLLTAKVLDENKISGYEKGADEYISKPFNPELLLIRVENLLQQRKHLREVFNRDFMLTPKVGKVVSPDEVFLRNLVEILNTHLADERFNVDKMCKMVHLSHMHFIRKVKQLTGKKPGDLLKSFRMKKAKELLAQKKLNVAEVAYRVGFGLPNSFSRAFKKEFDITPSDFVNSFQKDMNHDTESTNKSLSV